MPHAHELDEFLPVGLHFHEDDTHALLCCLWCGWERAYYTAAARSSLPFSDALRHAHTCPDRPRYGREALETR